MKNEKQQNYTPDKLTLKLFEIAKEGIFIPRTTEGFGYKYAPLDLVTEVISPILQKHKLLITHDVVSYLAVDGKEGEEYFRTKLVCLESGEFRLCDTALKEVENLKGMNKWQTYGSTLTYLRRYHISLLLNIVTEEDTDSAGVGGIKKKKTSPVNLEQIGNLIGMGKPEKAVRSIVERHKASLESEEYKDIMSLIETSYKSK